MNNTLNNRYQLKETLGQGGMGTVFRAYDRLTGQDIALKRVTTPKSSLELASRIAPDSNLTIALAHEFRTLASLRHPNIITVLDYGFEADLQPFFTMRLLQSHMAIDSHAKSCQPSERIALLIQVLQALNYLHRRGILHRDLKPSNVLVEANQVYLLDFGLALDAAHIQTQGNTAGTLAYLAPEVLQGENPSIASDLYAFGILAYEVLVGEHPFAYKTNSELIHKVLTEPAHLDTERIDDGLAAVIMRLLSKSAEDRYGSSIEALRALCDAGDYPFPTETEEIRESFLVAAKFVGREQEISTLETALAKTITGEGQAWLLGGESGVGKSRLTDELRTLALVHGAIALRGQAVSEGGLPYQLWREILRHLVLMLSITDEEAYLLKSLVPDIESLIGRAVPDLAYSNDTIQKRLPLLILSLITESAAQRPLVLLLEDLQWASESLDVLEQIVAGINTHPILIVANYRSDESPHLKERLSKMQYLALSRLSAENIRQLSEAMLGETGSQENVLELIQRESEGNAFFIVEVVRVLAEEAGQLANIGRSTLPAQIFAGGVKRIVERRLAQLPSWALYPSQVAAVAGRQINKQLITAVIPDLKLDAWLTAASDAAVFSVIGETWQFAHDKLREYVYENLEDEMRRKLHGLVASTIESLYAESLKDYALLLTQHFAMAGDESKEAKYALIAAEELITFNPQEARRYINRALTLNAQTAFENPQAQLAAMYRLLGRANMRLNDYDAAHEALAMSRQICETIDDSIGLAIVKQLLGEYGFLTGHFKNAVPLLEEALAVFIPIEDWSNIGYCYMNLGVIAGRQSENQKARAYFQQCLEAMEKTGDSLIIAQALNNLGISYDMAGEWDEAVKLYNRSLALRRQVKDKRGIAFSLSNLGALAYDQERFEDAKILRQEALRYAKEIGDRRAISNILDALGMSESREKNYAKALSYFEESLTIAKEINDGFLLPMILKHFGETQEKLGADGSPHYYEALAVAANFDFVQRKLDSLETLAAWHNAQGHYRLALRIYAGLASQEAFNNQEALTTSLGELRTVLSELDYQAAYSEGQTDLDKLIMLVLKERGIANA